MAKSLFTHYQPQQSLQSSSDIDLLISQKIKEVELQRSPCPIIIPFHLISLQIVSSLFSCTVHYLEYKGWICTKLFHVRRIMQKIWFMVHLLYIIYWYHLILGSYSQLNNMHIRCEFNNSLLQMYNDKRRIAHAHKASNAIILSVVTSDIHVRAPPVLTPTC